jgi:lipopolysaccharide/colanic/teichoic acid biosynthesis glycosyltransferase
MDLVVAAVVLVVTLPLQVVLMVAVRRTLGRPIYFRQVRPGLQGQPFSLVKFRTMVVQKPGRPNQTDAERMTFLGRWLRQLSLDEIPTFYNVLRGDMSLVGPRPLLVDYLPLYSREQARRHDVRPGVTGLAQVSGRNMLGWSDRFRLDVEYVDNWSISLDLRIMLRTVALVLRREGITGHGQATVRRFDAESS